MRHLNDLFKHKVSSVLFREEGSDSCDFVSRFNLDVKVVIVEQKSKSRDDVAHDEPVAVCLL